MTSKGQVTIPKALRQQLGLGRGSRVCFELVGDHIELRPWKPQQELPVSGFGLLKASGRPCPWLSIPPHRLSARRLAC